jgi:hypothetical protein
MSYSAAGASPCPVFKSKLFIYVTALRTGFTGRIKLINDNESFALVFQFIS